MIYYVSKIWINKGINACCKRAWKSAFTPIFLSGWVFDWFLWNLGKRGYILWECLPGYLLVEFQKSDRNIFSWKCEKMTFFNTFWYRITHWSVWVSTSNQIITRPPPSFEKQIIRWGVLSKKQVTFHLNDVNWKIWS